MKKILSFLLLMLLTVSMIFVSGCTADDVQNIIEGNTETLEVPTNVYVEDTVLHWNSVDYASGYTVLINKTTYTCEENSYSLQGLESGEYTLSVKANGDGIKYKSSNYSDTISYIRNTDTGEDYTDEVKGAFGSFDEVNTKNSFLGYGIDIINASAITSKNVLMTYPIFDMDKLMDETLLKSNEHYNSFESIEGKSIEVFTQNMGSSTSITSGQNVSAKGNIKGVDVKASASLSKGLTTSFTKTSAEVESQYFIEVIAENQSYWLILQTSEQRYKEILSKEFKDDLYNSSITPAQLFDKYGTHLLTSVAMGGNICMYYTLYSYDKSTTLTNYTEVSSSLKTNVEAAYGGYSVGGGTENSFITTFTYASLAAQYGIQVDKKIVSAGGDSFGINNEVTLFEKYYDWQKSLDAYPVVIGIKDTNSLYPIWQLLDLNVEGASERYTELYDYFQEYGSNSYTELCETYSITPSISPTDIKNIKVGSTVNYNQGEIIQVKGGDTLQISFDVLPANANKYIKTFSANDDSVATIDDTGYLTILPNAKGGSYITVTITAGSITKQISLYVVNTYNVIFNTRVSSIEVKPIYGVTEGYAIEEPVVNREGYTLEGWYKDSNNTDKFDFENDQVYSNLTLFAKWVAIKPIVSFDTFDGSNIDPIVVAYNSAVSKPKNPTKTGYKFEGWYEDVDCTVEFDFATTLQSDLVLYAKWHKIEYSIMFETNGGTPIASVVTSITENYKVEEPISVKTYYVLEGWYKDIYLTQKFYFETEITSDVTLYAKWVPNVANIEFVDSDGKSELYDEFGGKIEDCQTDITKGFKIVAPHPSKDGYDFVGWYLNGVKINLETYSQFIPTGVSYVLAAKWEATKVYVNFADSNGESKLYDEFGGELKTFITDIGKGYKVITANPFKEGYSFAGWYLNGIKVDLTKYSGFTPKEEPYKLIAKWDLVNAYVDFVDADGESKVFDEFGSEIDTCATNIEKGYKITVADPYKEGFSFVGWYLNGIKIDLLTYSEFKPFENNYKLAAKWRRNVYTVTYILNNEQYDVEEYGFEEEISLIELDINGYDFSGWEYGNKVIPKLMPSKNIVLTGSLVAQNYVIEYYVDGSLYSRSSPYKYGDVIEYIDNPYQDGKVFSGWSYANGSLPSTMPACNLRIEGGFDQVEFKITYYIDGQLNSSKNVFKGYEIPANNPVKEGYTFSGWIVKYVDDDGEEEEQELAMPRVMPANNLNAYGKFNINTYTIIFNTDGGNSIESIIQDYNTVISKPQNPTKTGYTFMGWDKEIPSVMPAFEESIVEFKAQWKINQYNIIFNIDDANMYNTISGDYNMVISKPQNPTKTGYTFAGWDKEIPSVMPAGNMTITAQWQINQYEIKFNTDGGSNIDSIKQDYDTVISKPQNPTKTGYTFAGWDKEIPSAMPAGNITITAQWQINQYEIIFNTDGGSSIDSIKQDYNTVISKPQDPTKTGYTFVGWDKEIPSVMPARNMTIIAQWEVIPYKINYNLNTTGLKGDFEVVGDKDNAKYKITTDLNIARAIKYSEYYTFEGWYTAPSGGSLVVNKDGSLVENTAYADGFKKWIYTASGSVDLYAHWEQVYKGKYIETLSELRDMEKNPTGTYVIIDDIDMNGEKWLPILEFTGTIDGTGNAIYNYIINSGVKYPKYKDQDLAFGLVGTLNGGTIKNLQIGKEGYITNIEYNANQITGSAGMIAGYCDGKIINCTVVNCNINLTTNVNNHMSTWSNVGGICGTLRGEVRECYVLGGKYYSNSYASWDNNNCDARVGGIVGYASISHIEDCLVKGAILEAHGGTVNAAWNNGVGMPNARAGGIAGMIEQGDGLGNMNYCVVVGNNIKATIAWCAHSASGGKSCSGFLIGESQCSPFGNVIVKDGTESGNASNASGTNSSWTSTYYKEIKSFSYGSLVSAYDHYGSSAWWKEVMA